MINRITVPAFAKINLTLDILGRRDDGYHDLRMIMQTVSLHDDVTVTLNNSGKITIGWNLEAHHGGDSNTASRAARAFFGAIDNDFNFKNPGFENPGVDIFIHKHIPMQAGLAGGSANAAAVLVGLQKLMRTPGTEALLPQIGAKIGADVPFCLRSIISGGAAVAEGIGDILTPIPPLIDCYILMCKPEGGVSTPYAYRAYDEYQRDVSRPDLELLIVQKADSLRFKDNLSEIGGGLCNVFEQVLDLPDCRQIRGEMLSAGALGSVMTGSGSAVFGLFETEEMAGTLRGEMQKKYGWAEIAQPI